MKKIIPCLLSVLLLLLCAVPAYAEALPAGITSQAFFVMDAKTGAPLFGLQEDQRLDPASVTKIMTVGLACEKAQGDWSTPLTVSHEDVHSLWRTDSSHIALQEGEVVVLEDMLYAAMIASANDACNVLAEYLSEDGTIAGGVAAMNAKAEALGLENTHFANPHGISEEGHYISARDLATILRWALQQPGFYDVFVRNDTYQMAPTNRQEQERSFWMHDYMRLGGSRHYIPEIVGSKMGYTNQARYTYACLAEKDGVQVICTVMRSDQKQEKYQDVAAILDYTFQNFRYVDIPATEAVGRVEIRGGGAPFGSVSADTAGMQVLLHHNLDAQAVTLLNADEAYVVGDALPQAHYQIQGGDVQMDSTVAGPLAFTDLDDVFANTPEQKLANRGSLDRVEPGLSVAGMLAAAVVVCLSILWAIGYLRTGRKQLQRFQK